MSSFRGYTFVLLAAVLSLAGCDSTGPAEAPDETETDTAAPAAPTNLAATIRDSAITLRWDAVAAADLTGYNVYRATAPIDDVENRSPRNASPLSETSYTDAGLQPGTTYRYVVTATDTAGNESSPSAPIEQATPRRGPVGGYTSQPAAIAVDGAGRDWTGLAVRHDDGGDGSGAAALDRLWVAHTEQRLFLRVTVERPINLEERNDLTLYLDTDNDPATGDSALGLGAELTWTFGARRGKLGDGTDVGHADIGLAALPTVQSNTFEIALDRSAHPGGTPLFSGDSLRIALSSRGDRLPDADGGLGYVLSAPDGPAETPSLARPDASDLRLLSYNVPNNFDRNQNTLFETSNQASYRRILQAAAPDVIGFQEMYDNTAAEVEQVVENDIDGVPDSWSWAKAGGELVLGSRHPIEATHPIPGADGQPSAAFLLDAQDALGDSLLVVLMHPKCCSGASEDRSRQATVDGVAAFLRDVQNGEGPFSVGTNTPIVVAGDMNFVGAPQQPRTLRTGQIQNTDRFGPPAAPDWDDSNLLDTNPRHTGAPLHTTTFAPGGPGSYPPGRLDYIYLTDSVLEAVHEFTLNTEALSDTALDTYGLQRDDTTVGSDHLPLVVDLTLR